MTGNPQRPSLHRRLLGSEFQRLPARVGELHAVEGRLEWRGRADVERGASLAARLIGWMQGLPPAGSDQPLTFTREPAGEDQIWRRAFSAHAFVSRIGERDGLLTESMGPMSFSFALEISAGRLVWRFREARLLGLRLPRALCPQIKAAELEEDGRYRFEVDIRLPLIGPLVAYRGWLAPG